MTRPGTLPSMTGLVGNKRPPLQSMLWIAKVYGQVSGLGHRGKAMVWIMEDQTAVVVQNAPGEPDGVKRATYPIDRVVVRPPGVAIHVTPDPDRPQESGDAPMIIDVVEASCVCGAGPTATAIPTPLQDGFKVDIRQTGTKPKWVTRA